MVSGEDGLWRVRIYLVHQPSQFLMFVYVESPKSNQMKCEEWQTQVGTNTIQVPLPGICSHIREHQPHWQQTPPEDSQILILWPRGYGPGICIFSSSPGESRLSEHCREGCWQLSWIWNAQELTAVLHKNNTLRSSSFKDDEGILLVQEFIKRITGGSAEIGTHAEEWIRCGCLVVEERRKTAATALCWWNPSLGVAWGWFWGKGVLPALWWGAVGGTCCDFAFYPYENQGTLKT